MIRTGKKGFFCLWLTALLMGTGAASGEDDKHEHPNLVNVQMGVNFTSRNLAWNRFRVTMENPGPLQDAVLVLEQKGVRSRQLVRQTKRVPMYENSKLTVDYPVWNDAPVSAKNKIGQFGEVILTDGHLTPWDKLEVLGKAAPGRDPLMYICDARFSSYNFVKSLTYGKKSITCTRLLSILKDFPQQPLILEGVDFVLVGDVESKRYNALQLDALRRWILQGGILIFVPGPSLQRDFINHFQTRLPLEYGRGFRVSSIEEFGEVPPAFLSRKGLTRYNATLVRGEILAGTRDRPMAGFAAWGRGGIVALTFDAGAKAFQDWEGATTWWSGLIPWPSSYERYAARRLRNTSAVNEITSNLVGVKIIPKQRLIFLVVLVLILMILPLLASRLIRIPERAWLIGIGVALVGGTAFIGLARQIKQDEQAQLTELYMTRYATGEDMARVQSALGIYTPDAQSYAVRGLTEDTSLRPGVTGENPPPRIILETVDAVSVRSFDIRSHDQRFLYTEGITPVENWPRVRARVDGTGLNLAFDNPTTHDFFEVFYGHHRMVVPVGELAADSSVELTSIRSELMGKPVSYSHKKIMNQKDFLMSRLRDLFLGRSQSLDVLFDASGWSSPFWNLEWSRPRVYFGSNANPEGRFTVEPDIRRRSLGFWVTDATLDYEGDHLLFPKGMLSRTLASDVVGLTEMPNGEYYGISKREFQMIFHLDPACRLESLESMRVYQHLESGRFIIESRPRPAGAASQATGNDDGYRSEEIYDVIRPDQYFDRKQKTIVLDARIRPKSDAPKRAGRSAMKQNWRLTDLDIEIKGPRS